MGSVPSRRKEIRVMLTVVVKTSIASNLGRLRFQITVLINAVLQINGFRLRNWSFHAL